LGASVSPQAFPPGPASPHAWTQDLYTIGTAGKCHSRNKLKFDRNPTPPPPLSLWLLHRFWCCCCCCCCHRLPPHHPRNLNPMSLVTQSTMLCRTWSRPRRPRLRCGGRRAVSGGGRRSARRTRSLGEDTTTQNARTILLFAAQNPEFDGRLNHGSIVHAALHPDKRAALRCPSRCFYRCPLLSLTVRSASQKQLFHLRPKP
jgi:hypothetical protein